MFIYTSRVLLNSNIKTLLVVSTLMELLVVIFLPLVLFGVCVSNY